MIAKPFQVILLMPGTVVYGGYTTLALWNDCRAVAERSSIESIWSSVAEIPIYLLVYGIPIFSLVVLWCLVLGFDSWIRKSRAMRGLSVLFGILNWLYIALLAAVNASDPFTDYGFLFSAAALGLLIVGAKYLAEYYLLFWHPRR